MAADLQQHCYLTQVVAADFVASVGINVVQTYVDAEIVEADEKINGHRLDNTGTVSSSSPIELQVEPLHLASAERQPSSTYCSSKVS